MFKSIKLLLLSIILFSCKKVMIKNTTSTMSNNVPNLYSINFETISGEVTNLEAYKGKKIMIVNTASKCGLTDQYKKLEEVYKTYGKDNFVILGFPANNFAGQEPGSNEEIESFCSKNYGVSFPMMGKISVKGSDMHPLYKYLTEKASNGLDVDVPVSWNFQKFMINKDGTINGYATPQTLPDDPQIINWIKN